MHKTLNGLSKGGRTRTLIIKTGAGQTAQWFRILNVMAEDLNPVPSNQPLQGAQLPVTRHRASDALPLLASVGTHIHGRQMAEHTHTHQKNKILDLDLWFSG